MKELRNGSLNLESINNIYMEQGRTNNWRASIIISEFIKLSLDTYRDECLDRKWEQGVMVKSQIQQGEDLQAHILCFFSNFQCGTTFSSPSLGHFFTQWSLLPEQLHRCRRESDLFITVSSPLFSSSLRSYSLYVIIWPLVSPLSIITSAGKNRCFSNPSI